MQLHSVMKLQLEASNQKTHHRIYNAETKSLNLYRNLIQYDVVFGALVIILSLASFSYFGGRSRGREVRGSLQLFVF